MPWLRKPSAEIAMPMAMKVAPRSPKARRMTSVAGVLDAASAAGPSAWTLTNATAV